MNYKPKSFHGNEGVVGLTRWIEKMEFVFLDKLLYRGLEGYVHHLHLNRCRLVLVDQLYEDHGH